MWFRSKERGTRARSSDGGHRSGLNHTRGKRGKVSPRFYFLVNFSPALLGSWLCIILDPTAAPENYPLPSFVSLLCFFRYVLFCFFAIRIILECKQTVPFSSRQSSLSSFASSTLIIFHVTHHVTAFDQWNHPFIGVGRRKRCSVDNLSSFLRNFQTSSCFYHSCSHGLIQSSQQAFNYPKLLRDRSKDGLHVAAFSLLDSWSLGNNKLIEFISNFLPLNSQGLSIVFTFEKKTASYQFSIGP